MWRERVVLDSRAEPLDLSAARLLQLTLVERGQWAVAARLGPRLFASLKDPVIAYTTACALGRFRRPEEGLTWLQRAVDAGYLNAHQLDNDPDLKPLRKITGFRELREGMTRELSSRSAAGAQGSTPLTRDGLPSSAAAFGEIVTDRRRQLLGGDPPPVP